MRLVAMGLVLLMGSAGAEAASGPRRLARRVDAWLEARSSHDKDAARRLLAPGAVIRLGDEEGVPVSLDSPAWGWDDELGASTTHGKLVVEDRVVTGVLSELNDFYRLLDIAAWKASVTFSFDASDRIAQIRYVPLPPPANPDLDAALAPAVAWMRVERPEELADLMPRGSIARNRDTARRWRAALIEWRAATGLRPASLPQREVRIKPALPPGMLDPPEIR